MGRSLRSEKGARDHGGDRGLSGGPRRAYPAVSCRQGIGRREPAKRLMQVVVAGHTKSGSTILLPAGVPVGYAMFIQFMTSFMIIIRLISKSVTMSIFKFEMHLYSCTQRWSW